MPFFFIFTYCSPSIHCKTALGRNCCNSHWLCFYLDILSYTTTFFTLLYYYTLLYFVHLKSHFFSFLFHSFYRFHYLSSNYENALFFLFILFCLLLLSCDSLNYSSTFFHGRRINTDVLVRVINDSLVDCISCITDVLDKCMINLVLFTCIEQEPSMCDLPRFI